MNWTLEFSPLIAPFWLSCFTLAIFAVVIFGLLRKQHRAIWRMFAGFALLLVLANPTLQRELRDILPSVAAIVIDESASQTIGERREQTQQAVKNLQAQLKNFQNVDVRIIHAGASVSPDSKGTELFQPLVQGLSDVPAERIAGAFLITDGQVHDVPAETSALPFHAPLHALITGEEKEHDRRVVVVDAPRFALLNSRQKIRFRVEDNDHPDERVGVQIRLNGNEVSTLNVRTGQIVEHEIEIKTAGENVVEISAENAENELTALNNRAAISIKGVRENLRVLLISGEPHSGERTWRNLLKADPAVDLVHFTILRPPDKVDATPIRELSLIAFPVRELFQDKIGEFDLIIFDRYERRNILPMIYFSNMADYVNKGGAVLVVSGPEDHGVDSVYQTALASVLPVEPTGELTEKPYLPQLSEVGFRHPVTRGLPGSSSGEPKWGRWFRAINVDVKSGETLMTGPSSAPLLVLNRAGEGRTATLLSDQVWLWARNFEGGGPHTDLLRRVVHWLMKEPDLDEETLRAQQNGTNISIQRQSMSESGTAVQVQRPDGAVESIRLKPMSPGLWQGTVSATLPGLYRITHGDKTALLAVGPPNPQEFVDMRSTKEKLGIITQAMGGTTERLKNKTFSVPRIRLINTGDKAYGTGWAGLYQRNVTDLKGIEHFPLLQTLLGLLLTLSFLSLAWFREGR
ncbi:MAG: hypothetical protein V4691_05925 [Pseudomonadota bacterium]